jgi:hypothetical protein
MKITLVAALLTLSTSMPAPAQSARCDPGAMRRDADEARELVAAGVDGDDARETWARVLECGGAIAWTATLYNVDARATFVFAFARDAIRVYRTQAAQPEAAIPWDSVREIESGNWVIWFRLHRPVEIASDRGKRHRVRELKVFLHGGHGGEITYYYDARYAGRDWLWGLPV